MRLVRHTVSLCPTCYREIPAEIYIVPGGVRMGKVCPEHGPSDGLVEKDPVFYTLVRSMDSPFIYAGYFVDVTRACNLRCEYCYYPLEKKDPEAMFDIPRVVADCAVNKQLQPFVLTGGEPTTRPDICDLIEAVQKVGSVEMLTNGVTMADPKVYDSIVPLLLRPDGSAAIHLSIHPQAQDSAETVLQQCCDRGIKMGSCLIVIDSETQFTRAMSFVNTWQNEVLCWRIKAASRIWHEQKPSAAKDESGKVFVSDMLDWLDEMGGWSFIQQPGSGNKSVFVNVRWRNSYLMLVSWHDVNNVDLLDIACAPFYRARNGEVCNFVTAGLINEGMQKGWMKGTNIQSTVRQVPQVEALA
jgi:organic radical activating enzyme